MTTVMAPLAGTVTGLGGIPDPVFAQGMVGDGVAVLPDEAAASVRVLTPVAGTAVKVMPHAFVIATDSGAAVLVHIGIDTVGLEGRGFTVLEGRGFTVLVDQGARVASGQPVVEADLSVIRDAGLSPCCPVVVLDTRPGDVVEVPREGRIESGNRLFDLPEA